MSFRTYQTYKDSGSEWLGRVPTHWTVTSLGRITDSKCDGPFGSGLKSDHYTDSGALVVRLQNIRAEGFFMGEPAYIDLKYFDEELRRHEVVGDDILIAGLGDENNVVGRACVAPNQLGPSLVKADCFRFRVPSSIALPTFLASQLTAGARCDAGRLAGGSTRSRIPLGAMASRSILLPPVPEQLAIVEFLEHETSKINALVEEQGRLITLLKEKRQALISQAVTKGLNQDVPMKDSEVEWLGNVPAHWEVIALRRCVRSVETGGTPSAYPPAADVEDGFVWYTPGDFGDSLVLSTSARKLTQLTVESGDAKIFPAGSVLVVSIGATLGKVGFASTPSSANQQINAIIPNVRANGYFLAWSLRAKADVMRFLSNASTIGIMNQEKTKDIWLALPPISEQVSIASKLDRLTEDLDALTHEAESAIELLQERRAALIAAAVTGKIDVRGLVLQLEAVAA